MVCDLFPGDLAAAARFSGGGGAFGRNLGMFPDKPEVWYTGVLNRGGPVGGPMLGVRGSREVFDADRGSSGLRKTGGAIFETALLWSKGPLTADPLSFPLLICGAS